MEHIIVYGSQYGSTRRYAEKLSEQTGIPAVSYKDASTLSDKDIIVYLGGLYAVVFWAWRKPCGALHFRMDKN